MKKKFYKSKTVDSALVIIVIAILNILGVGEVEIGKTYDTLTDTTGHKTEAAKDVGLLIGGAGAIYGRYKAKGAEDEE